MHWFDWMALGIVVVVAILETVRANKSGGMGLALFDAAGVVVAAVAAYFRKWWLVAGLVALVPLKLIVEKAVVKQLVERERPGTTICGYPDDFDETCGNFRDVPLEGLSFVSGHAIIAWGVAALLWPVLPGRWRWLPIAIATLNAIALFIPPGAKVVTMEDTREINLPHENWIPGATRSGSGERGPDGKAAGEIDMYDLVRAALRQRPNYIIVGEVRGKETYTMFQAMATGHTTYSTMHADSVKGMVNRLENPPINCPRILLTALRNVIIQTHARVGMDMVRRIKQLIEIVGFEPETNELISNTVYEWDQATDKFIFKGHSFLFDKIMEMKNLTHEELLQEFERRVDIVKYMVAKDLSDHQDIWDLIRAYYKDPKATAEMARKDMVVTMPAATPKLPVAGGVASA